MDTYACVSVTKALETAVDLAMAGITVSRTGSSRCSFYFQTPPGSTACPPGTLLQIQCIAPLAQQHRKVLRWP
eukprot:10913997-Lingulodinium_polyedra.AAC.1